MAIPLNDNILIQAGKPVEPKYLNGAVPYANQAEVLSVLPISVRHEGLKVRIGSDNYEFLADLTTLKLLGGATYDPYQLITTSGAAGSLDGGTREEFTITLAESDGKTIYRPQEQTGTEASVTFDLVVDPSEVIKKVLIKVGNNPTRISALASGVNTSQIQDKDGNDLVATPYVLEEGMWVLYLTETLTTNAVYKLERIGAEDVVTSVQSIHLRKTSTKNFRTADFIDWDIEDFKDTSFTHDLVTDNSRIGATVEGLYNIDLNLDFDYNTGNRLVMGATIYKNGIPAVTKTGQNYVRGNQYDGTGINLSTGIFLSPGDYIEVFLEVIDTDTATSTINLDPTKCEFIIYKFGGEAVTNTWRPEITDAEVLTKLLNNPNTEQFTTSLLADLNQNTTDRHTHANKALLDALTNAGNANEFLNAQGAYVPLDVNLHTNRTLLDSLTDSGSNSEFLSAAGNYVPIDVHTHLNKALLDSLTTSGSATAFLNAQGNYVTVNTTETLTSLSIAANQLSYLDENGDTTNIDLSLYLDDTNLARLTTASLNPVTGIATFTRDDATTFDLDLSSLIFAAATQAEAEAGTETELRSWSPLRIKQAITANTILIPVASEAELLAAWAQTGDNKYIVPTTFISITTTAPIVIQGNNYMWGGPSSERVDYNLAPSLIQFESNSTNRVFTFDGVLGIPGNVFFYSGVLVDSDMTFTGDANFYFRDLFNVNVSTPMTIDVNTSAGIDFKYEYINTDLTINNTGSGDVSNTYWDNTIKSISGGGASNFLALLDTPGNFTGSENFYVRVNAAGNGLEFTNDTVLFHANRNGEIDALTEKGTPANDDWVLIEDSADSNNKKKIRVSTLLSADGTFTAVSTLGELQTALNSTDNKPIYVTTPITTGALSVSTATNKQIYGEPISLTSSTLSGSATFKFYNDIQIGSSSSTIGGGTTVLIRTLTGTNNNSNNAGSLIYENLEGTINNIGIASTNDFWDNTNKLSQTFRPVEFIVHTDAPVSEWSRPFLGPVVFDDTSLVLGPNLLNTSSFEVIEENGAPVSIASIVALNTWVSANIGNSERFQIRLLGVFIGTFAGSDTANFDEIK